MATRQAISTVSYNTPEFLDVILNDLIDKHIISFYAWIFHKGEFDERLNYYDKDHIHIYIQPNQLIDLMDLKDLFIEPDPHNDKPLGVISFRTSNWDDWFLYELHDEQYLKSKFLSRQYHYTIDDFVSSDYLDFMDRVQRTYALGGYASNLNLVSYLDNGGTLNELTRNGGVSPNRAVGLYYFHELLYKKEKNVIQNVDK